MADADHEDSGGADKLGQAEGAVYLMLTDRDEQRPWSLHEVALEVGDAGHAADAVRNLRGAGLVHELHGFVWATRAALAASGMGV